MLYCLFILYKNVVKVITYGFMVCYVQDLFLLDAVTSCSLYLPPAWQPHSDNKSSRNYLLK